MDYPREKLWVALNSLVGASSIQNRLTFAAESLMRLKPDDFTDPELRAKYESIFARLTVTPLSDERSYTPRQVSDEDGAKLAEEILSLYIGLRGGI